MVKGTLHVTFVNKQKVHIAVNINDFGDTITFLDTFYNNKFFTIRNGVELLTISIEKIIMSLFVEGQNPDPNGWCLTDELICMDGA